MLDRGLALSKPKSISSSVLDIQIRLFLTVDGRVPRDTGNHFLHGAVKVCKGLVLFKVGVALVPKGAFFLCKVLPVIDECVHDFVLLKGYFNTVVFRKEAADMLGFSVSDTGTVITGMRMVEEACVPVRTILARNPKLHGMNPLEDSLTIFFFAKCSTVRFILDKIQREKKNPHF